MALSSRLYISDEGGTLKRVPRRVSDALVSGDDAIPEYANTRQRVATVLVENEQGKPVRILDVIGSYWTFDEEGRIDKDLQSTAFKAMEFAFRAPPSKSGKVVDLRPDLQRKQFNREHRWEPTAEDINRMAADIWPNLAAAAEVQSVKGKAPKRPPLTSEAKDAITDFGGKLGEILRTLDDLSEPALKGLAFEANRLATAYKGAANFWRAIAEQAEEAREIKARHRTGKGIWYAVLTVWHNVGRHQSREAATFWARCDGKKQAIEAGQRLLAEKAPLRSN